MLAIWVVAAARQAAADHPGNAPWRLDAKQAGRDSTPPDRPRCSALVHRGSNPEHDLGDGRVWSLPEAEDGVVTITVQGSDDQTPEERLGYRLAFAGGRLPPFMYLPSDPIMCFPIRDKGRGEHLLWIVWRDWDPQDPEHLQSIEFALQITCLDGAGNESAPSDTLWVTDPGR